MNLALYYARTPYSSGDARGHLYSSRHPQWQDFPHELLSEMSVVAEHAVLVCTEAAYQGNDTFADYWVPSATEKGVFEHVNEPIKLDGVFNKGYFEGDATFSLVNVPAMRLIGRDKSKQYELFGHFQPVSRVASARDLEQAIDSIPGDMVVIKPLDLNGGRGVLIDTKSKVKEYSKTLSDQQWLIQEFIDSTSGITGLVDGVHDVRLYIIDGEVVLGSIRRPAPGKLVANTSQGGTIDFYAASELPQEPVEIARSVDQYFTGYGNRFYSVDFVYGNGRWYVLEVNDRPGIPARVQSPHAKGLQERLAQAVADSTRNTLNKVHGEKNE